MTAFLQNCLNGISIGSIYALIAIGYTMVYGILRLINFAHGDIFMMAGYFMIICMTDLLIPWYISLLLVVLFTVLLGVFIERIAYKPLRDAPRMSIMISAIGVSYFLQNFATYLFTAQPKSYPYAEMGFLSKTVKLGEISTTLVTFITPILTVILVLALVFLIRKTKIGMAMRAVSRDFETSELMGIDINRVIKDTAASFEGTCSARDIVLDLTFTDDVLMVYADLGKIQQVLYNLLDNAIKFSHNGSVIYIQTAPRYEKVFVSVKDTGVGIPKDSLKKIWDRFYKSDLSRGKDKKGTGLGLSNVKEIIQAHGENIDVISTAGVGSEFIFTLPRAVNL